MREAPPAETRIGALGAVPGEFLYAKLRGRKSLLLEGEALRELAREPSLDDLALRLYPSERLAGRAELERVVLDRCVAELAGLGRYAGGAGAVFYRRLLSRYAVENLKVLLRLHGAEEEDASMHLVALPGQLALPVERLAEAPTLEEFVQAVPMPHVRRCGQEALRRHGEEGNRAYLEMAFDKGYWQGVWDAVWRLPAAEARESVRAVQAEFDAMRLLATLRAAAVYELSWEEWAPFLPTGRGRIGESVLRDLHARPELDYVAERLPQMGRTPDGGVPPDIGALEEVLWRRVVRIANGQFYTSLSAVALLVSYFYLKRNEMRHLLGLAQLLTYGRPADGIVEELGL